MGEAIRNKNNYRVQPVDEEFTKRFEDSYTDYAKEAISNIVTTLKDTFNLKLSNRNRIFAVCFTEYFIIDNIRFKVVIFDKETRKFGEVFITDPKSLMMLKNLIIVAITLESKANDDDYVREYVSDIVFFNSSLPASFDLCYDNVVDYASEEEFLNDESCYEDTYYLKEINPDKIIFKKDSDNSNISFTTFDEIGVTYKENEQILDNNLIEEEINKPS